MPVYARKNQQQFCCPVPQADQPRPALAAAAGAAADVGPRLVDAADSPSVAVAGQEHAAAAVNAGTSPAATAHAAAQPETAALASEAFMSIADLDAKVVCCLCNHNRVTRCSDTTTG